MNRLNNDELCKRDAIKNLFMSLGSQIEALTKEIKFLCDDSKSKSIMINKSINITHLIRIPRQIVMY